MRRVTAVILLVTFLLTGCSSSPKSGEGFRFPLSAEPVTLDPQIATDEAARTVIASLFEGLVELKDGRPVPAAADWTVSEDGLTYVFALYPSKWSSGEEVTADDFLFAYERITDPATASPHRAAMSNIQTVTAEGNTLKVTLKAADEGFLAGIVEVWYPCPRTFFEECRGGYGMEPDTLWQNGAFTLETWEHGKSLLMYKHEDSHRAADIAPGAVRFVIGAGAAEFAEGKVDACRVEEPAGHTLSVADTLYYLWFNTTVSPLTAAEVRVSLRDAIEWQTVNTALPGTPVTSYVSAAARDYTSTLPAHKTAVDREAFANALTKQGLATCPSLTLLCEEGEETRRLAQYIVQSWQKNLAVYFTIEQVPKDKLLARLTAGNYHLALAPATARGDSPADALRLFAGEAAHNWSRFQDKKWEKAVNVAGDLAALQTAEEALAAACPAVPLAAVPRVFALAEDVSGVDVIPFTDRLDFHNAMR